MPRTCCSNIRDMLFEHPEHVTRTRGTCYSNAHGVAEAAAAGRRQRWTAQMCATVQILFGVCVCVCSTTCSEGSKQHAPSVPTAYFNIFPK